MSETQILLKIDELIKLDYKIDYLEHNFICKILVAVSNSWDVSEAFFASLGNFVEKKCSKAGVHASKVTPFLTNWFARFFASRDSSRPHLRLSLISSDEIGDSSSERPYIYVYEIGKKRTYFRFNV